MISVLIKASVIISILLCFYKLFLEKESFFSANRIYLLSCLMLAATLPFIELPRLIEHQGIVSKFIEYIQPNPTDSKVVDNTSGEELNNLPGSIPSISKEENDTYPKMTVPNTPNKKVSHESLGANNLSKERGITFWLMLLYYFGVAILSMRLLAQLIYTFLKIYKTEDKIIDKDIVLINLTEDFEPCSFFKYIFINPESFDFETYEQIVAHEKIHVKYWHTIDLLLAELAVIILWFNPFSWVMRKEIENNLEFQTDNQMVGKGIEAKQTYQLNLVKIATYRRPLPITSNYNQSSIKKRILKMNAKKSNHFSFWKYIFATPLLFSLLLFLNEPNKGIAKSTMPFTSIGNTTENDCERLSIAVHDQNIPQIETLLSSTDPNCTSHQGEGFFPTSKYTETLHTPLSAAAKLGNLEIANLLLEAGAKIDSHDVYLQSPLMAASLKGNLEMVKFLIKKKAKINPLSDHHGTALHCAARNGHLEIAHYLLDRGANINSYTYLQGTPLSSAAKNGHNEMVSFLIEKGATIDNLGAPLARAAGNGHMETIELLLSKGAQIDYFESYPKSALYTAAWNGQKETVTYLLSKGASLDLQNTDRGTALIAAAKNGHIEVIELLLAKGAQIDLSSEEYGTALIAAAVEGNTETVKLLLSKGAQIDLNHDKLGTALMAAASKSPIEIIELLVAKGAQIDLHHNIHGTALIVASSKGRYRIVDFLISNGANIYAQNKFQGTALHAAARNGQDKTLELLLSRGADINALHDVQGSVLHTAARKGQLKIVKLLVEKGANINLVSKDEGRPIDAAYRNAHVKVVKYLEANGAQPLNRE